MAAMAETGAGGEAAGRGGIPWRRVAVLGVAAVPVLLLAASVVWGGAEGRRAEDRAERGERSLRDALRSSLGSGDLSARGGNV